MITSKKQKVITIVGPTSIGKTSLSIEIAKALNTEIISADSRQVYKGLDLGTGKITKKEMDDIAHYLLDVEDPNNVFSASNYLNLGKEALDNIFSKNKIPIIIGGTGFYIDVLLEKITLPNVEPNNKLRKELELLKLEELQENLRVIDPERYETIDLNNPRRIIRAIEIAKDLGKNPEPSNKSPYDILWVGLKLPISELKENIHDRIISRLKNGMLEESIALHKDGLTYERMEELGLEYLYMARHLSGQISHDEMIEQLETETVKYARRQMTWFKKNKEINWFSPNEKEEVEKLVKDFIK